MLDEAVKKIKDEINIDKKNRNIQGAGNFILRYLNENPNAAEKIINPEKTIKKSLLEVRKAAEKYKEGTCAYISDEESFEIILKYFEIDGAVPAAAPIAKEAITPTAQLKETEKKASTGFDVKLDDFF